MKQSLDYLYIRVQQERWTVAKALVNSFSFRRVFHLSQTTVAFEEKRLLMTDLFPRLHRFEGSFDFYDLGADEPYFSCPKQQLFLVRFEIILKESNSLIGRKPLCLHPFDIVVYHRLNSICPAGVFLS